MLKHFILLYVCVPLGFMLFMFMCAYIWLLYQISLHTLYNLYSSILYTLYFDIEALIVPRI